MRRWTTISVAAAAVVAGTVLSTAGSASAAVHPDFRGTFRTKAGAYFYPHSGGAREFVGANVPVEVTCYYIGTPVRNGDAYQDHIDKLNGITVDGHIVDEYVNLGGHTPPQLGIPVC